MTAKTKTRIVNLLYVLAVLVALAGIIPAVSLTVASGLAGAVCMLAFAVDVFGPQKREVE